MIFKEKLIFFSKTLQFTPRFAEERERGEEFSILNVQFSIFNEED
jgi:hypothetical protein